MCFCVLCFISVHFTREFLKKFSYKTDVTEKKDLKDTVHVVTRASIDEWNSGALTPDQGLPYLFVMYEIARNESPEFKPI